MLSKLKEVLHYTSWCNQQKQIFQFSQHSKYLPLSKQKNGKTSSARSPSNEKELSLKNQQELNNSKYCVLKKPKFLHLDKYNYAKEKYPKVVDFLDYVDEHIKYFISTTDSKY